MPHRPPKSRALYTGSDKFISLDREKASAHLAVAAAARDVKDAQDKLDAWWQRKCIAAISRCERLFVGRVCFIEKRIPTQGEFRTHFAHKVLHGCGLPQLWSWKGGVVVTLIADDEEQGGLVII